MTTTKACEHPAVTPVDADGVPVNGPDFRKRTDHYKCVHCPARFCKLQDNKPDWEHPVIE